MTPPCGVTFYNGLLPLVLPFWTPKKEAKKVPATSDSAGGPAQGARPLGTPKRWSVDEKAKKRRSAALFLTLFRHSPFDPSGAKRNSTGVGLMAPLEGSSRAAGEGWPGGSAQSQGHPSVTYGDSSPQRGAFRRTVGGEHCSPAGSYGAAKLPGRTLFAPTDQHKHNPTPKTATLHNPPGRRGRRPLQPTQKPQQTIEILYLLIVECWPRAGASPSALGFLRARLRSVRAKREPKRP